MVGKAKGKTERKTASLKANRKKRQSEVIGQTYINNGQVRVDIMSGDKDSETPAELLRVCDGSTLERWRNKGRLSDPQYLAGRDYQRDFYRAHLSANYAKQTLERVQGAHTDGDQLQMARDRFYRAHGTLGASEADVVWFVLGEGLSLTEYAMRRDRALKNVNRHIAGGLLLAGLERLAKHYGH